MISNLYQKSLYTLPIDFVIHEIYEYDISKANISILLECSKIDINRYNYLASLPKIERQIQIGMMQKDKDILEALNKGFEQARLNLINANLIQDDEIISIKKDAIFVTRPLEYTKFGYVKFNPKNRYQMMINMRQFHIELYYDGYNKLDVKGIRDDILPLHAKHYVPTLIQLLNLVLSKNYTHAINYISHFIDDYNDGLLEPGFYREFNANSKFKINAGNRSFYLDMMVNDNDVRCLDKSYNQALNRELYKTISKIYFAYNIRPKM